jgi:predicted transcriptional regulator
MTEPSWTTAPADVRRQAVRLSGILLLDTARLIARAVDSDLVTACVYLAITRANVRAITADAEQSRAYAALGAVPPQELRAPVSVYSVAKDMRIPYETARRHVAKLVKRGMCLRTDEGLVIPNEVHLRPQMMAAVEENWQLAVRFLTDLAACGVQGYATDPIAVGTDVRRQVLRLSIGAFLEALEALVDRVKLDLVHTLLYVTIMQANVRHLSAQVSPDRPYSALDDVPPDTERRPISVYAVAREMGLPYETARRHVSAMIEAGLVVRSPSGGVSTPTAIHATPEWLAGTEDSWRRIQGMVRDFAKIGVTADTVSLQEL